MINLFKDLKTVIRADFGFNGTWINIEHNLHLFSSLKCQYENGININIWTFKQHRNYEFSFNNV